MKKKPKKSTKVLTCGDKYTNGKTFWCEECKSCRKFEKALQSFHVAYEELGKK